MTITQSCKSCAHSILTSIDQLGNEFRGRVWQPMSDLFFVPFDSSDPSDRPLGICRVSRNNYEALTTKQKIYKTALLVMTANGAHNGASFFRAFGFL